VGLLESDVGSLASDVNGIRLLVWYSRSGSGATWCEVATLNLPSARRQTSDVWRTRTHTPHFTISVSLSAGHYFASTLE